MVMVAARLGTAPRSTRVRYAVRWHASRGVRLAIMGALALAALAALAPVVLVALGYQPAVIGTQSLAPAFTQGDVVVNETRYPDDIVAGDVVTFSDAGRGGATFTERVVSVQTYGTGYAFATTDGTSGTVHRWSIPQQEPVTRVAYHLPLLRQPVALASAVAAHPLAVGGAVTALLLASAYRRLTA